MVSQTIKLYSILKNSIKFPPKWYMAMQEGRRKNISESQEDCTGYIVQKN